MNLRKLDKQYVWHPYTQMQDWQKFNVRVIKRGKGSWLIDTQGRKYIDGVASMWCNVWGHSRKEIVDAMTKQASRLQHSSLFGLANESSIRLAEMLVKEMKGMSKVFYSDNGSTAMEVALKMAVQYWRNIGREEKDQFICLENGYHGDTMGCMSVGYIEQFFSSYKSLLFPARRAPSPYMYRRPYDMGEEEYLEYCIDSVEKELKSNNKIAAVVMESGAQVAGGAIVYPEGYQRSIKKLCEKYDVLFVLDEIATGFGRLGSMAEYMAQDSIPDIAAFGKMLTAGYMPLSVTMTSEKIYDAFLGSFDDYKHLFHGHTYTGNPLACTTAIANMKLYKREGLIDQVRRKSKILSDRLKELQGYGIVGDTRHKGLLAGIELVNNKTSKEPCTVRDDRINYLIMRESIKRGVYLRPLGHVIMLVPPLAVSTAELNKVMDIVTSIIRRIQKVKGLCE